MTNEELWGPPRVYVHLIHGTWARHTAVATGRMTDRLTPPLKKLLPRRSAPKPAWFEPENGFHDALLLAFQNEPVTIDGTFSWSGNNSFGARQKAARDLQSKLEEINKSYPGAAQIIVAHSHGGTLAALALSHMPTILPQPTPSVRLSACRLPSYICSRSATLIAFVLPLRSDRSSRYSSISGSSCLAFIACSPHGPAWPQWLLFSFAQRSSP